MAAILVLVTVVLQLLQTGQAARLESHRVDGTKVSVSGISSGACMATQFHVAHSSAVMGVGMIAGVPFMCSEGNVLTSTTCMLSPATIVVSALEAITASADLVNNVDSTSNMQDDKIWIFAGTLDSVVRPTAGHKVEEYYRHYVNTANIKTVFNVAAEHCMPTDNYGGQCDALNSNYINNCNFNAAYDLLNHIYGGNLARPVTASGTLMEFDQSEFFHFSPPSTYSMDTIGYVYVPTQCQGGSTVCKLHIAFHGCQQGRVAVGDAYVRHAGYNEVAEANNIIILYPQVIKMATNPMGCWDWFGYTGALFATKSGFQMTAVYRMMQRVMGN